MQSIVPAKIAFVGDVHGRVLHTLGALLALQRHRGIRLDAVIQVGDLGAFPSLARMDAPSRRFAEDHPSERDFMRLLDPSPDLAGTVRSALQQVPPIVFVSGNHEDFAWLAGLHAAAGTPVVPVDPLGAIVHVACGEVLSIAGQRVAFLGRIEEPGYLDLDEDAYARLLAVEPSTVDILVTHDGPVGICRTWRGEVAGSPKLTRLIEHLRPRLHVSGHYHHENGPRHYGPTRSYALAELVFPKTSQHTDRTNPRQRVSPGAIGLLDTEQDTFEYVHDPWLAEIHGDRFDLARALTHH